MLKKQHLPPNIARLMLCVLCSSLLTGCWDRIEVEDRAVVLAMAIDPVKDDEQFQDEEVTHERGQEPRGGKIRVTMQIAVPGRLPWDPQMEEGKGEPERPNRSGYLPPRPIPWTMPLPICNNRWRINCFSAIYV